MDGANRSLAEFVSFLSSPDMYGSMSTAATMMSWLIHFIVVVLMVAAVLGVVFIMFKFACDVVFLSGFGQMMGNKAQKLSNFASDSALTGDIYGYIRKDIWKLLVTLAFIGILASGMALPLAGQFAGAVGAMIDKVVGVDPAGKLYEFDFNEFEKSITYMRDEDKKAAYDEAVSQMKSYRDQIYTLGQKASTDKNDSTLEQYKQIYTNAYLKANALSGELPDGVESTYKTQHSKTGICVKEFFDTDNAQAKNISCGTGSSGDSKTQAK